MFAHLAVATKRVVALVAFGQEIPTDVQSRDFLIAIGSDETEPQAVAMEQWRRASLNLIPGVESAAPAAPATGENTVVIAYVTMNTTQIESIDFRYGNRLPSVQENQEAIGTLNNWRARVSPALDSLQSQIAAVEDRTANLVQRNTIITLAGEIARLKAAVDIPAGALGFSADRFSDLSLTDQTLTASASVIDHGLHFPAAGSASGPLALFNPIESRVKKTPGDFVLPAYTEEPKLRTDGYAGDLALSQYQATGHTIKKVVTTEHRWVASYTFVSPYWENLYRNYGGAGDWGYYEPKDNGYYESYPVEKYVESEDDVSYNGVLVGQTFLAANSFWLTSVGLYFTAIGPDGDVTVSISGTNLGQPDVSRTYAVATVNRADLKQYPVQTRVPIDPIWIEAGKRYSLNAITQGAHRVAVVVPGNFTQGTLFYSSDQAWYQGDLSRDLMFALNGAAFDNPRVEVAMQSISLAGGIADLDIRTAAVVPEGTTLNYEVQVAGVWRKLADGNPLWGPKPDLLPIRMVLLGTRDAMPGIQLGANRIKASRPASSLTHVSALRDLDGSSDDITVTVRAVGFDSDDHTLTCQLVNAAGASPLNPSLTETKVETIGGGEVTSKIYTFTPGSPLAEYKIKIGATRGTALPFTIAERVDVAL